MHWIFLYYSKSELGTEVQGRDFQAHEENCVQRIL